jgi:ferrous iron transport protein B
MSAHAACAPPLPTSPTQTRSSRRIALVGNPNTGKTTVFNRLCGANEKTANFPGTTTAAAWAASIGDQRVEVVDLPGVCWPRPPRRGGQ